MVVSIDVEDFLLLDAEDPGEELALKISYSTAKQLLLRWRCVQEAGAAWVATSIAN
jgi:hypothetical protein